MTDDGSQLTTTAYGFSGGVKARYPMGESEVGFGLSYGSRVFDVGAPETGTLPLPDEWRQTYEEWAALGATHITVNTMNGGLRGPEQHIERIRAVKAALA